VSASLRGIGALVYDLRLIVEHLVLPWRCSGVLWAIALALFSGRVRWEK